MNMTPQQAAKILKADHLELSGVTCKPRYGRRPLSPAIRLILWVLRMYVLIMMLLIGYQLWITMTS